MAATRRALDPARWHFQHGPIDCVIQAEGEAAAVQAAHEAAWARFEHLLDELVAELPVLRAPVGADAVPRGAVAQRMHDACARVAGGRFITPMAAVAGSVAQELVAAYARPGIRRAWVNNGGDIALHLAPGEQVRIGLFADLARFEPAQRAALPVDAAFTVDARDPVRGVATSGWRGRSFSLGIADSVTVLAATAALADAAATVIANAVDLDDPAVVRRRACDCKDDSDLGERLVTVDVGPIAPARVRQALARGERQARALQATGGVHAAMLVCQKQWCFAQPLSCASGDAPSSPRPFGVQAIGSVFA